MRHAILDGGSPVEYAKRFAIDEQGTQHPLRGMDRAEKLAYGVYEIERDIAVPTGHTRTGLELVMGDGVVIEQATTRVMTTEELKAAVNVERDRRLSAGVTVTVTGYGDIPAQGGPGDQINMIALGDTAKDLIGAGVTAAVVPFRDASNIMHTLTPTQVAELVRKSKEAASAIYATSWAMKDGTGDFTGGIPADYANDGYWPQ